MLGKGGKQVLSCCGFIYKDLGALQVGEESNSSVEGGNSSVLSHPTVVREEKDAFLNRGYFWKKKVLYKHVPEAERG